MNFKDFLNEKSAVNKLADNKSEKLTDKKDLEVFSELVRFRTQYAKKNGQEFDSKSLEKTKDELTKLYNFAKSKADPTTGKQDSAAKSTIEKIQKIKDGESKEDTEDTKEKDSKDSKDSEDKDEKDADFPDREKEDPAKEKMKELARKEAKDHKENREKSVGEVDDDDKEKLNKTILDNGGIKLAGHALDAAITALATMLGIDANVSKMVQDLASNIESLNNAIKQARDGKEKAKKERDKQLKNEIDNYDNAKKSVETELEKAKGDDKKKLKKVLDDVENTHQDNIDAINKNAKKKIDQYDAVLAMDASDEEPKKSKDKE